MSVFTGRLGDILATPGGLVLGFGGESLSWEPLNLFLKVAEIPSGGDSLPLHTLGVFSGVANTLPLIISGKTYGKGLNLYILCNKSDIQQNMNLFVEGANKNLSSSLPLLTVNSATELVENALPLILEAPVFGTGLNLVVWRTPESFSTLPLTITGYAQEASAGCVLYLVGPVGSTGSLDMITAGTGVDTNSVDLITHGYIGDI
jgi:hypothetical protein